MKKTVRFWDGTTVMAVLDVHTTGYVVGAPGGAAWSGRADIEIDPFKGTMVVHDASDEASHVHEFPVCSICVGIGYESANNVVGE